MRMCLAGGTLFERTRQTAEPNHEETATSLRTSDAIASREAHYFSLRHYSGKRALTLGEGFPALSEPAEEDDIAKEDEAENQHHGRDVEAAEIGKRITNRAQDWVGKAMKRIRHQINGAVPAVHHVEDDKPAQDRADDQHPDIEVYHHCDKT